jgi:dTDP-4-dehydrorhamnose reductase
MAVLQGRFDLACLDIQDLDVGDPGQCREAMDRHRPDIVLNCAAFTDVDKCESERATAARVNAGAPGVMADWVERHRAYLVHISTDFVFDGARPLPGAYVEEDPPAPLSYYGQSKLDGEQAVAARTRRHATLRTAWLYGARGRNFLKAILKAALRNGDKGIRVVNDQFGCPTWATTLALQIARVVESRPTGLFHAAAQGWCSRDQQARRFLEKMGVACPVTPCRSEEYPTPARRPANSILENRRLKEEGLHVMKEWTADMDEFVARHGADVMREIKGVTG